MKRIFASILGLITLAVVLVIQFEVPVSPQVRLPRFTVRVYNVDEVAIVYLNEREIGRVNSGSDVTIDIGDRMWMGINQLKFVVENQSGAYTFGFEVKKDGEVIHAFECGRLKQTGCGDSPQTGIVFEKTVTLLGNSGSNVSWNAGNILGNMDENANMPSNAWSPASNYISNAPRNWNSAVNAWANSSNVAANTVYYPPANPITNIRTVDFANLTLFSDCDPWEAGISLINGRYKNIAGPNDIARIKPVRFVDFNGDGKLEAFVVVEWTTTAPARKGMNAHVFAIKNGEAEEIWSRCHESSAFSVAGRTITHVYPEDGATVTETHAWLRGGITNISTTRK